MGDLDLEIDKLCKELMYMQRDPYFTKRELDEEYVSALCKVIRYKAMRGIEENAYTYKRGAEDPYVRRPTGMDKSREKRISELLAMIPCEFGDDCPACEEDNKTYGKE